jgi:hypothetical protein
MQREPFWTGNLAVGSSLFVEQFKPTDFSRRETEMVETVSGVWGLCRKLKFLRSRKRRLKARLRPRGAAVFGLCI